MTKQEIENSVTGLRFNQGKPQWHLVHFKSLEPMIRVLEYGANKYTADNWKKGLNKKEILDCLQRHVADMMDGLEVDHESGLPLIGHVLCNALFYSYFSLPENEHKVLPDNYKNPSKDESSTIVRDPDSGLFIEF